MQTASPLYTNAVVGENTAFSLVDCLGGREPVLGEMLKPSGTSHE